MRELNYDITKEIEFDAGHRVPNHSSKCRNPHGHRYRVVAHVGGSLVTTPGDSSEGMLADFGDLKTIMMSEIHDPLDHGFIIYENDMAMLAALGEAEQIEDTFEWRRIDHSVTDNRYGWKVIVVPFIPTAENLAKWCFDQIRPAVNALHSSLYLLAVTVWETPTSSARYSE